MIMTMATVNPKLSSLNYVNKEHEESLKGITSHLHFVVDDFYKLLQAYITHIYPFLMYRITAWGNAYKSR